MASSIKVESLEDLALLNEDNAIRILLNGTTEKYLAADWIKGDQARGAHSVLAKMVLGTSEGLAGTTELQVEESLESVFDLVLLWLALGDVFLQDSLTDENATMLFELASYFGLDALIDAIKAEETRRDEMEKQRLFILEYARLERERLARLEQERQVRERASGTVRCVSCGTQTTKAPTYRGNTPRCWSCRNGSEYDDEYDDYDDCCGYDSETDGWSYGS